MWGCFRRISRPLAIDFATSYLPEGYQTDLHAPVVEKFGGPFAATGAVGEWAGRQADKLVDAPVSAGRQDYPRA